MRIAIGLMALALTAAPLTMAHGQASATADIKTYAASTEVQALIVNARKLRKPGQALVSQHILSLAPYNANLEYRVAVGPAAVHEKDAEFFYVIDGSGTLISGGKLVGETRQNPTNLGGTAIEGGEARKVAKGDFIVVPENTPHWFSVIDGELLIMSLHVPRG